MAQEFFSQAQLDIPPLRDLLSGIYASNDAAERWDQGLRIARTALLLAEADAGDTKDADLNMITGLALVCAVRTKVVPTTRVRASVEAYFVSQGWTQLRSRELMRGLERLPDKPQTVEEKIVADAETLTRLGVLGLVRAALTAGEAGLAAIADLTHKNVHRRMFTRAGQNQAVGVRDKLRDLSAELRKVVEAESATS